MAVLVRPTNGVSYGVKYTITAADVTAGSVLFDFSKNGDGNYRYDLVASVAVDNGSGVIETVTGLTITYPKYGQILVAGTLTAGYVINLVAQAALTGIVITP